MSEAPYLGNINWLSFRRNLYIALGIIGFSSIIFYLIWLRSPFLTIRTPWGEYRTSNPIRFLYHLNKTVWNTNNQNFWFTKGSLEGYTYVLIMKS